MFTFSESHLGKKVQEILETRDNHVRMIMVSEIGSPALIAIDEQVRAMGHDVSDYEKRCIGKMVKEVMAKYGWETNRVGRLPKGHFFKTGAVYDLPSEREADHSG